MPQVNTNETPAQSKASTHISAVPVEITNILKARDRLSRRTKLFLNTRRRFAFSLDESPSEELDTARSFKFESKSGY